MDPFSGESELLNISTAFYTHTYQAVLDFDISTLSPANRPIAQLLKYRSEIATGRSAAVIRSIPANSPPALKSIRALAQHATNSASGLQTALELAESDAEDAAVQVICGIVLASGGETAQAIELLSKHQGSLEAVVLLTQIHLSQNRTDLALKEVLSAKRWAQDSLLINLAEAWLNMRVGGTEKYQSAFYVYEELASTPGSISPTSLVGQAVAELHLGRLPEAEAALGQAMAMDNADVEALANTLVLAAVMGKKQQERDELLEQLKQRDPDHALLRDLEEKSRLFDTAAAKYSATAAS